MKYTELQDVQNTYPDEVPVGISYSKRGSAVRYTGLFSNNFVEFNMETVDNLNIGNIYGGENSDIGFIVRFDDGDEWTSLSFKNELQRGMRDGNPYFTKSKVTIVNIKFSELEQYWKSPAFVDAEIFAGVTVTDSINTKEDMFLHISWMVTNDIIDKLRKTEEFGNYTVNNQLSPENVVTDPPRSTASTPEPNSTRRDDSISGVTRISRESTTQIHKK